MKRPMNFLAFPVSVLALAALSACGGGSDTAANAGPDPVVPTVPMIPAQKVNLAGTVAVNGLIRNAVVCLDLNANSACDASEPVSAATGINGVYNISFERSAVTDAEQAASSLIALVVPGELDAATTTIDQAKPEAAATTKAYVLKQVPGKSGQINPLTTLVSAGVASGMSEAVSRSNAARQLGIDEAKIDGYQDDAAYTGEVVDSARTAAVFTAMALEDSATLVVGGDIGPLTAQQGDLRSLSYTDFNNYRYYDLLVPDKSDTGATADYIDHRVARWGGSFQAANVSFNQAYLTPDGWQRCDQSVPVVVRAGTPSRSSFCGALDSITYRVSTSIADRPMAEVVSELASDPLNNIAPTQNLFAALAPATFPAGSTTRRGRALDVSRPIYINNIGGDIFNQNLSPTLEKMVGRFQASGVVLATASGSLTLGLTTSLAKNLRVAFTSTVENEKGTVQYYECDLNADLTISSNCVPLTTGTFSISSINGVRILTYGEVPPTPAGANIRMLVEVKPDTQVNSLVTRDAVFAARQQKPAFEWNTSTNTRLNGTAWAAMKTQLGL